MKTLDNPVFVITSELGNQMQAQTTELGVDVQAKIYEKGIHMQQQTPESGIHMTDNKSSPLKNQEKYTEISSLVVSKNIFFDPISKLHEEARCFLHTLGFLFEEDFYETNESEQIKFVIPHEDRKKRIKCWLKCRYLPKQDGTPGLCITFGAFHHSLPHHDTKTFWADSNFELTQEERLSINERLAEDKQRADEREKEVKKAADEKANWCLEKYKIASIRGNSPYFDEKGIKPIGIRYEIRREYREGNYTEETVALIFLSNIQGKIRAFQEIYPSKRKFHENEKPRNKNSYGAYSGCFFTFGKIEDGKPICIAEGYATAASIFESTNYTTLMVVSCTNILNVAKEIKKKCPKSEITICGDDDVANRENPGRKCATEAAQQLKCKVAFPIFPKVDKKRDNDKSYTDFNDLMLICNKDEVNRQVNESAFLPELKTNIPDKRQHKRESKKILHNELPIINIIPGQLHNTTNQAEQILINNYSGVFQRAGKLVRIITEVTKPKKNKLLDKDGQEIIKRSADALLIAEVDPIYLTELLGRYANWTKFDERIGDWTIKDCPERVARTLMARREWNIPVLAGIIQAPTLRYDGTILDNPGYDENTGLFFNPGDTQFFPIPAHPSKDDAIAARNILLDLLKDFPFENEESKSVALSAILTALIRKSIRSAPLHGFTAPKMGSGKSLLADVVGLIATGKSNSAIPQAENEGEEKKRLLAVLAEGDSIICFDNIERPFGSAALCSVLTQEDYKDRILGITGNLNVPTNATFLATGNNLTFVGDTSTRAILCALDPQCERPEERVFNIDLRQYIPIHRGELVKAALTILRAYHIEGRPKQNIPEFGRFEDWSNWIRSSLVWLELEDPCVSRKEIENADPTRQRLANLLSAWYAIVGDLSLRTKDIIKKAEEEAKNKNEILLDVFQEIAQKDGKICSVKLGANLKSFEKRPENGLRLQKSGKHNNADLWRVTKI
jgi:phage/plasmid primase-like uncharacterized protein